MSTWKIIESDCLETLKLLEVNSLDSLVTDPPAGISFMSKDWDSDKGGSQEWIYWLTQVMAECLRVLKPGAHGLVWSLPRTSYWTATALERAGFEVRDCVTHLFGQGFPKSMDVSKAIDKAAGAERRVIGRKSGERYKYDFKSEFEDRESGTCNLGKGDAGTLTAPATPEAKQWEGWGTALKPAAEFWWLVRKPLSEKTVAANVLKWGTGALNIDASRIEYGESGPDRPFDQMVSTDRAHWGNSDAEALQKYKPKGRFPANLVLSHSPYCDDSQCDIECAISILDQQSGALHMRGNKTPTKCGTGMFGRAEDRPAGWDGVSESGYTGASRFFYCAKVSPSERSAGLEGLPDVAAGIGDDRPSGQSMSRLDGRAPRVVKNHHPTVKSIKLMTYLTRMITPPKGIVLDPFAGSGSTGVAAMRSHFGFVGIEQDSDYALIARRRLEAEPNWKLFAEATP